MNVKAVIGAGFGDEGKGLMTDCFSSPRSLTVRYNGGAQAGHTVVRPDGRQHVFHHFGSGTLAGADTYLGDRFIVNPMLFVKEYEALKKLGVEPTVYVDPLCMMSTPYDMMLNEIYERSINRKASCGCGINETMRRCQTDSLSAVCTPMDEEVLRNISFDYVPSRLREMPKELEVEVKMKYDNWFHSKEIRKKYLQDFEFFKEHTQLSRPLLDQYESIVFEGAQGLMLDQDHRFFPFVTHSKTGSYNIIESLSQDEIVDPIELVYATRCYTTRHGDGPFPTETTELPYPRIADSTNVENPFQGKLRYGLLDYDNIGAEIGKDFAFACKKSDASMSIAITCLDQCDNNIKFVKNDKIQQLRAIDFIDMVRRDFPMVKSIYTSHGRTRDHVLRHKGNE